MIFSKMTIAIVICLAYIFSLIIIFFSKSNARNDETKIYGFLLVLNFFELLIHIVSENVCYHFDSLPYIVSFLVLKSMLISYFLYGIILFMYLIVIVNYKNKDKILNGIAIMGAVISLSFLFMPLNVSRDNVILHFYTYGLDVNLVYIMSGIIVAIMMFILITHAKTVSRKKVIPLLLFFIGAGVSMIIQKKYPYITITDLIESVICCLMYFTIENPDVKMVQQLELAKRQADRANNAKTEFLSSMSHEIRTPLNAISGFSDCILDAKTLDEAKENAKDIVDASDTLLDIVNGILDISKIEAGKIEIVNSTYDAPATFKELAKLITPKMKEKGLFFTYYIAPDLPKALCGDSANIKKIVTNLLSNACKYTKSGFVKYEVNCVNMNDYCRLVISVEDSGQGIKKENINKLFTRFQRLEEDKNITIEGTGLGLAITKQLTEMMGGKVIVHSVYGTGSKFTVVLNQKIDNENTAPERKYKTTLDLHDVRVLVVDDNVLNIKVAKKLLERHNANNIKTCESGFDCINRIGKGEIYDIILLDDMMPKMSGIETLQKLKSMPNFKTPVIALTANAITGMKEHYLAEGFDNYLAKPIQDSELIRTMNEVLGRVVTEQMPIVTSSEIVDDGKAKAAEIIPVEENIEEELGDKLNISTKAVEISVSPFTVKGMSDSNVEMLDDDPISDDEVNTDTVYGVAYLKSKSVDVDGALQSLGDMETYNMAISTYLEESNNIWNRIVEYKESNNITDYATEVHALKSSSRYIGLTKLGDIAYQHELKSKANDVDYINDHFSELENEYNKTIEIVKNYVKYNKI